MKYKDFPKFVKIGEKGCCLRKRSKSGTAKYPEYYRDGGMWEVGCKNVKGVLLSKNMYSDDMNHLDNIPLIEVTFQEWVDSNEGYLPENFEKFNTKTYWDQMNGKKVLEKYHLIGGNPKCRHKIEYTWTRKKCTKCGGYANILD